MIVTSFYADRTLHNSVNGCFGKLNKLLVRSLVRLIDVLLLYGLQARNTTWATILGGSWDLVSKVISTLIGVISSYMSSYLIYNPTY